MRLSFNVQLQTFADAVVPNEGSLVILLPDLSILSSVRTALLITGARAREMRQRHSNTSTSIDGTNTSSRASIIFLFQFFSFFLYKSSLRLHRSRRIVLLRSRGRKGAGVAIYSNGSMGYDNENASGATHWQTTTKTPRSTLFFTCPLPKQNVCIAWTSRLAALTSKARAAQVGSAWISTLGGGHFLCRHVPQSLLLARLQVRIAESVGDLGGARRARLHFVYAAALTGRWAEGRRLLEREKRDAIAAGDVSFCDVAKAAQLYLRKTRMLARRGQLTSGGGNTTSVSGSFSDNLHRQRIVKYYGEGPLEGSTIP